MRSPILTLVMSVVSMCVAAQTSSARASQPPSISYVLSPVFAGNRLSGAIVEMTLQADPSGKTVLDLPDEYGGAKDHWRYLADIDVSGASVSTPSPNKRILTSSPNARIKVRYSVSSAYKNEPAATDQNLYSGAVIRPTWFASLGEFIFMSPKGGDNLPARFYWRGWPSGWTAISSEEGRQTTVSHIISSSMMAGADVELRTLPIAGGRLRFASHGKFAWSLDAYAARLSKVITAQRLFWGGTQGDYTASLIRLEPQPNRTSIGGTGRDNGFVQYTTPDGEDAILFHTIAHEHTHNWISRQIGELPHKDEATAYWLSEGFTDFYTARTLLRSRLWTPAQFVADFNQMASRLATSKARNLANSRIPGGFWSDPAVEQLPYDRGHIFAHLLDHKLKAAGKPGIDQLMFAMKARWMAAPPNSKPLLIDNFLAVLDSEGFDARPLIKSYIEDGKDMELPTDLLGPCAQLVTLQVPNFEVGFDRDASAAAGKFFGVDPSGPAYAAGLRDGMKRLARVSGEEGNPRFPLTYKVDTGTQVREISWLPAGTVKVTVQELRLLQTTAANQQSCADSLSGFH